MARDDLPMAMFDAAGNSTICFIVPMEKNVNSAAFDTEKWLAIRQIVYYNQSKENRKLNRQRFQHCNDIVRCWS